MSDDPAKARYFAMTAARIAGALLAVVGIVLVGRPSGQYNTLVGYLALAGGLFVIVVVPRRLARRWRTPPRG